MAKVCTVDRMIRQCPLLPLMSEQHQSRRSDPLSTPLPTFCPRCRKCFRAGDRQTICPICGDRLIHQGYCPVCEAYLAFAVGVLCPKHDLPLEAVQPPSFDFVDLGAGFAGLRFATLPTRSPLEAPRIRLEAEGIPDVRG